MRILLRKLSIACALVGALSACASAKAQPAGSCIAVIPIPDEAGAGRAWFRMLYRGPERDFIPEWRVFSPQGLQAYLEVWSRDVTGRTAWAAGPEGEYVIEASVPCGRATWAFHLPDSDRPRR